MLRGGVEEIVTKEGRERERRGKGQRKGGRDKMEGKEQEVYDLVTADSFCGGRGRKGRKEEEEGGH